VLLLLFMRLVSKYDTNLFIKSFNFLGKMSDKNI